MPRIAVAKGAGALWLRVLIRGKYFLMYTPVTLHDQLLANLLQIGQGGSVGHRHQSWSMVPMFRV